MSWTTIYDGVFFISLATILTGSFGLAVKYCLKSKCENLNICCGLIEIKRRVDLEVQEEMAQIERNNNNTQQNNDNLTPKQSILNLQNFNKINKNNIEDKNDYNV